VSPADDELSREEIERSLRSIIADMLGCEPEEIGPSDDLGDDLGLDSMDAVDMVVDLKLRTGVKLVESDIKTVQTLRDVVDVTHRKTRPSG